MANNNNFCSSAELKARLVAVESGFAAFKDLMNERDKRYEQRSIAQDDAVGKALDTSKEAVDKAEAATEKRLGMLNELRGVVLDQNKEFARASEVNLRMDNLDAQIKSLTSVVSTQQAHVSGIRDMIGWIAGAAGLILAGLAIYFKH